MKRWGVIIAVALTLLLGNANEVKAQVVVKTEPIPITDSVICPDGCNTIGIAQANDGPTEFDDMGTIYLDSNSNLLPVREVLSDKRQQASGKQGRGAPAT